MGTKPTSSASIGGDDDSLRSVMPAWISVAHRSPSMTLPNSTSSPSPVVITIVFFALLAGAAHAGGQAGFVLRGVDLQNFPSRI